MDNAFYYDDRYYLLPEGFDNYGAFIGMLRSRPLPVTVQAVALPEDHRTGSCSVINGRSMAPYFLSGYHDVPTSVTVKDPRDVYPVHVELYGQADYNAKLRKKILEICPGCLRYKPLTGRAQSLNGHFEEMGLDGVCLFRQETKPAPRSFHDHLFSFGGFYMRFQYNEKTAEQMLEELKSFFYARYAAAELCAHGDRKELTLCCRKNELLLPALTDAIGRYLDGITGQTYGIRLSDPVEDVRAWLEAALAPENGEIFQKDCKKYGISIGILEYAPEAAEKVRKSLKPLVDHYWIFPLLQENGREYLLLADTATVLKELRYRAPLLQHHGASIAVHSQYGRKRYTVSFAMACVQE